MAPKGNKTPKPQKDKKEVVKKEVLSFAEIPLNEPCKWTACVALLVGNQVEDDWYINGIGCSLATGCRQLFCHLSWQDIQDLLTELMSGGAATATTPKPKGKKGESKDPSAGPGPSVETTPELREACAACYPYVKAGIEPPLSELVKIIKFKLLEFKNKDIQRRNESNKEAGIISPDSSGKGKKGKDKSKPAETPTKPAKKKEKEEKKEESITTLVTREEMAAVEKLIINDEPLDGAQLYILLTGFTSPHLVSHLAAILVEVNCIIKVRACNYEVLREIISLYPSQFSCTSQPTTAREGETNSQGNAGTDLENKEPSSSRLTEVKYRMMLQKFWCDISAILDCAPENSWLHNVARLECLVPDSITIQQIYDPSCLAEFFLGLYNDVSCLMYNVTTMYRHWQSYLCCLKLNNLPPVPTCLRPVCVMPKPTASTEKNLSGQSISTAKPPPPADVTANQNPAKVDESTEEGLVIEEAVPIVDMSYYTRLMDSLPVECTSVPLIMHCMLEQLSHNEKAAAVEVNPAAAAEAHPASEVSGTALSGTAAEGQQLDGNVQQGQDTADASLEYNLAARLSILEARLGISADECAGTNNISDATLAQTFPIPSSCVQPELLSELDEISHRLDDGVTSRASTSNCGFNPKRAELEMLHRIGRIGAALQHAREIKEEIEESGEAEKDARLQQLMSFCSTDRSLTQSEVLHSLQQFIFECIDLAKVDSCQLNRIYPVPKRVCPPVQCDIAWDDPYPYYMAMRTLPPEEISQWENNMGGASGCNDSNNKKSNFAKANKNKSAAGAEAASPTAEAEPAAAATAAEVVEEPVMEEEDPCPIDIETTVTDRTPTDNLQKRSLDEFCYAEHFQSGVVLQVIADSLYTHPYVECYRCRRDGNLFVVLDSPFGDVSCGTDGETPHSGATIPFQAYSDWHAELHSNVGFRYFLEYVAEGLSCWITMEETRRQASLLAAEMERINREEAESRGVSDSEGGVTSSAGTCPGTELDPDSDYVRIESLKAWKTEQEQKKKQEEELASARALAGETGSSGKSSKADKKGKKGADSKSSSPERAPKTPKTPKSKKGGSPPPTASSKPGEDDKQAVMVEVEDDASFYPFVGYNMKHKFVHVGGVTHTLYPPNCSSNDKSLVRTERILFRHGKHFVKGTVCVDGHIFNIHVLEPRVRETCGDETEACDDKFGIGAFASLTAALKDGITLALSHHGPTGKPPCDYEHYPEPYVPPEPLPETASVVETLSTGKKGKKDKDSSRATSGKSKKSGAEEKEKPPPVTPTPEQPEPQSPQQQQQETAAVQEGQEEETNKAEEQDWQNLIAEVLPEFQRLFVTCPNGLNVKYYRSDRPGYRLDDGCGVATAEVGGCDVSNRGLSELCVRQTYLDHSADSHSPSSSCGGGQKSEWSRVATWDGTVVKTMSDGTVEILYADGSVKEFLYESPLVRPMPKLATPSVSRTSVDPQPEAAEADHEVKNSGTISPERKESNHNANAANEKSPKKKAPNKPPDKTKSPDKTETERGSAATAVNAAAVLGESTAEPEQLLDDVAPPCVGIWISTSPAGERTAMDTNGCPYEAMGAMVYSATDPMTREVMHSREDHVITVFTCDDSVIVEHRDKTRITTRYVSVCEPCSNEETGEIEPEGIVKHYRIVEVEHPCYATLIFNEREAVCHTIFGSGTMIDVTPEGEYSVTPLGGGQGCLQVGADGRACYTQRCPDSSGKYQMYRLSHVDNCLIEYVAPPEPCTVSQEGGETTVLLGGGASNIVSCALDETVCSSVMNWPVSHDDVELRDTGAGLGLYLRTPGTVLWDGCTELGNPDVERKRQEYECCKESEPKLYNLCGPAPRFFIINPCDLTGVELLRPSDLCSYFQEAECNPATLVLKDELMDCPGVTGISVMKPQAPGPSYKWAVPYRLHSIVPKGLKSRDLRSIPAKEVKRPGPKFGESAGRGLCIGPDCSCGCCYYPTNRSCETPTAPPPLACPSSLDYRMFLSYRPVNECNRARILNGLKCFADHVLDQEDLTEKCQADSPPADSHDDSETCTDSQPDILNLEQQGQSLGPCAPPQPEQTENLHKVYEEQCNAARSMPPPPPRKYLKDSGVFDRDRAALEREEDKELRRALRECKISPYFLSECAPVCMRSGGCQTGGGDCQCNTCSSNANPTSIPKITVEQATPLPEDSSRECSSASMKDLTNGEEVSEHDRQLDQPAAKEQACSDDALVTTEDAVVDESNTRVEPSDENRIGESNTAGHNANFEEIDADNANKSADHETAIESKDDGEDKPMNDNPNNEQQSSETQDGLLNCTCCYRHHQAYWPQAAHEQGCSSLQDNETAMENKTANLSDEIVNQENVTSGSTEDQNNENVNNDNSNDVDAENEEVKSNVLAEEKDINKNEDEINKDDDDRNSEVTETQKNNNNRSYLPDLNGNLNQNVADLNGTKSVEICEGCSRRIQYCGCYPQRMVPPRPVHHLPQLYTSVVALQNRPGAGLRAVARDRYHPTHEVGRLALMPQRADFGFLKEGCSYCLAVNLKNLGYDPCRFRVKQPPPATGIRVIYTPGPILAGLKTQLQVQLFAIAVGVEGGSKEGVGLICHNLEILTETGTLYLPITANILSAQI